MKMGGPTVGHGYLNHVREILIGICETVGAIAYGQGSYRTYGIS